MTLAYKVILDNDIDVLIQASDFTISESSFMQDDIWITFTGTVNGCLVTTGKFNLNKIKGFYAIL